MNKRIILTLIVTALLLSACVVNVVRGSGNLVTESRSVRDFDRISLSGSGEVTITQGDEESLTVETDDNVMQYVTTQVRGGTLYLGFRSGINLVSTTRLRFDLHVKDLNGVQVSGSGKIVSESLDTGRLDVDVSGSGDVQVDSLTARDVQIKISGSGDVELAGEVTEQDITISGSGKYHAGDLRSERAGVSISGSGDSTIWATEVLDVRVSGSGSVKYYGQPRIDMSGSGSGKVRSLGEK